MMMLHIHSWNVQGLEMPDRKYLVRRWCNRLDTKDIICLQEIKVVGFQAHSILKFLWDKAVGFHSNHERGKGGVAILVNPKWESHIVEHGYSPCQRIIWVSLKRDEIVYGICNVYASNNYRERAELWDWCCSNLPKIHWVFVGDFNMVEHRADKSGGLAHSWKGNELFFWHKFKRKFNLTDPMENMHGKFPDIWFTWCNN